MDETEDLKTLFKKQAQGALSLNVAFIGVVNALFTCLKQKPGSTPGILAQSSSMDPEYVARWCDAAYAFGYLDDDGSGMFSLTRTGEAMCPDSPETLMPMAVGSVLSAHMAERTAELMRTGERPGEKVLGERKTILPWFGPMLEANFSPLFEGQILPRVPEFEKVNQKGGLVVDLGCGNGWYLKILARHYPDLRGIGLDGFRENIDQATRVAMTERMENRLTFLEGNIREYPIKEPVDLFVMNRALHHVWSEKETVFSFFRDHLQPDGAVVIWEPAWPLNRKDLRDPARRPLAFQGLGEHVQGNRLLNPEEIAAEFSAIGLQSETMRFANGNEAVIIARRGNKPG
ncbi:MAG: class I SAM-dependent methyltransferase [Leptospirales bacterium]